MSGRPRNTGSIIAAVATLALVGACTTAPPTQPPAHSDSSATTIVGETSDDASGDVLDLRPAYPMRPGSERWTIVDGDGAPGEHLRTRTESDLHGAHVAVAFDDRRTQYWVATADGVAMAATHSHRDRAISLFEPPLPIGPAKLGRSIAIESTVSMTVVDEKDPSRVRQRGTATRRIEWIDDVDIERDGKSAVAHRIETRFVADLDLARAEERATLLFMPGVGFVEERRDESIRALGLFGRTVRQSLRRSS